jgi:crotonobetainyl-CoA:carnitine CoA-transferase CaiB-like acyl-CoA transferase
MQAAGIAMRTGNTVPRLAPFGIFETGDGYVALCAPTEAFARGVFKAIGRPELEGDERFSTRDRRVANARSLHAVIDEWAIGRTTDDAVAALAGHGVPVAVVRSPEEAVQDELLRGRGETVPLVHPTLGPVEEVVGSGLPIRFSDAAAGYTRPAPWLGEHNEFVYGGLLGYDAAAIDRLRARSVI